MSNHNTMGNLLLITGENVKEKISQYFSQAEECSEEIIFDFASQINRGDCSVREASDIDETLFSYAEIKAITSGNPKIKRKMEIEQRLGQLSVLEKEYRENKYFLQSKVKHTPEKIAKLVEEIEGIKTDIRLRDRHKGDKIQLGKNHYEERVDAGRVLLGAVQTDAYIGKTTGFIQGFRGGLKRIKV